MSQEDKINELADKIRNFSKCDYYQIELEPNYSPDIFDSKLGGLPYWTPDRVYPVNTKGEKLVLFAQINFDKENVDEPLPKNGMLQFYIADDIIMGLDFDDQTKQNNFRVIYHENIDYNISKDSIKHFNIPNTNEKTVKNTPILKECKINLKKGIDHVSFSDVRFDKYFTIAYKEIYNKDLKKEDTYFKILNNEEREKLNEKLEPNYPKHKMLGYSYFTQEDPRYNKKYIDYDTLLLQIDSDCKNVMWGDVGIGNFFISKKSLLEKDFSNVLYNWDCS